MMSEILDLPVNPNYLCKNEVNQVKSFHAPELSQREWHEPKYRGGPAKSMCVEV